MLHDPGFEAKSDVLRICSKTGAGNMKTPQGGTTFCTNFAFGKCEDKECPRIHGCPFCGKVSDNVAKCIDSHTARYGFRMVPKDKLQTAQSSGKAAWKGYGKSKGDGWNAYDGGKSKSDPEIMNKIMPQNECRASVSCFCVAVLSLNRSECGVVFLSGFLFRPGL